ncbi:DUF2853 family protein [Cereibacter sphaeroides]|uniref:DUF2853 family protein n=1 Tax=Cereibacter sphaeroides TaxID=1063 RepID=UPI001F33956D|nr:DUF2853 family protein [Cereibacter sphaeroides]MCE6960044.1 DUF2853 family protein [Cereibacter sphaeroides]MCE6968587.1 DUF2853 family protein [Cereibacter sphaeroides]MCE6973129.1 DUF2853 family protein [Cereibacter sphaeroides]
MGFQVGAHSAPPPLDWDGRDYGRAARQGQDRSWSQPWRFSIDRYGRSDRNHYQAVICYLLVEPFGKAAALA